MRRGATTLVLSLVLVLVALSAVTVPEAGAAARCTAPGAKTVLKNARARLFYVRGRGAVKRRFYGCLRGHKPILLTSNVNPKSSEKTHTSNTMFRLAGPFVAWVETAYSDFGVGEFGRSIEVRALEPRHRKVSQEVSDYRGVGALALRGDGAVAWILRTNGSYTEVDAVESTSREPTPLAYARGIAPDRLRVDTASVFWTQDGAERSAPLR